jgi:hypothetical protein
MEEYLINRVDNYVTNNALAVYDYSLSPGNSAQFEVLGDEPVEIVLDGLCGCTALLIASRRAVYFAHFLYVDLPYYPCPNCDDELTYAAKTSPSSTLTMPTTRQPVSDLKTL